MIVEPFAAVIPLALYGNGVLLAKLVTTSGVLCVGLATLISPPVGNQF
jgi:hypothetical protein